VPVCPRFRPQPDVVNLGAANLLEQVLEVANKDEITTPFFVDGGEIAIATYDREPIAQRDLVRDHVDQDDAKLDRVVHLQVMLLYEPFRDQYPVRPRGELVHEAAQRLSREIWAEIEHLWQVEPVDAEERSLDVHACLLVVGCSVHAYAGRGGDSRQTQIGLHRQHPRPIRWNQAGLDILGIEHLADQDVAPDLVVDLVHQPAVEAGGHRRGKAAKPERDHDQQERPRILAALACQLPECQIGGWAPSQGAQPVADAHAQWKEACQQQGGR
jgi:hypothetical protein